VKSHCFVLYKIDEETSMVVRMEGVPESIIRRIWVIAYQFTASTNTSFADHLMLLH